MQFTESPIWKHVREMDDIIEKCDAVRMDVNALRHGHNMDVLIPRAMDDLHKAYTALETACRVLEDAATEVAGHAGRDDEQRNNVLREDT